MFVEFHPWFFYVKDQDTKRVLLKGRCVGGLYPLVSSSSLRNKQVFSATKLSATRWHDRLGHPSFKIVQQILSHNKIPCSNESSVESICDSCQRAKSHQLPYIRSSSFSTVPLELVYSDVWGPAPTSVGNFSYYVSFIDDFSKFSWIYLLKKKSEVFQVFQNFQNLVERKFDRKILTMQTDWGGEYEKLNPFFTRIGISHHVSCPYAHQQNGSAERKHRHIVEVGLALLANSSMPLKFWDEAFLTATHLINMLPSPVINNETPLERLYNETPDYASLRVFGCACWPNLRPYNQRKLAFRSKQCVFLGYSHMHKGVKCLDISSGRVYISRDVVFDETVFPFAQLHPNAGQRLRHEILLFPEFLQNPSMLDSGGQQCIDLTANTPASLVPLSPSQAAGRNLVQNGGETAENEAQTHPVQNANDGTTSDEDSPDIPEESASRSASTDA